MRTRKPRVLVLTLFSGENEFKACAESVQKQNYPHIDHIVIRDLPNTIAHQLLYTKIMQEQANYNVFIKLDADMVLTRRSCVSEIVEIFAEDPRLDHLESKLFDAQSQNLISGLHAYSNRVHWQELKSKLFVDPYPVIGGARVTLDAHPAPFATHMENPSIKQCFIYGYHRALKIIQKGVEENIPHKAKIQLDNLAQVAEVCRNDPNNKRIAILAGAEHGLKCTDAYLECKSALYADIDINLSSHRKRNIQNRWRKRSPVFLYRIMRYTILPERIQKIHAAFLAQSPRRS